MSVETITPTVSWQQVSAVACVCTITRRGEGYLIFNESGSDEGELHLSPNVGDQIRQDETKPTWVKTTDAGWEVRVDRRGD